MKSPEQLLLPVLKLRALAEAVAERERLARTGRRVVLTNGCFDLLHAGHIHFLEHAAQQGDALFVALNSDASVRALKGPRRPIQSERERAYALGALACVHTLVQFDQPRLVAEIRALRPDVYVKAGDYTIDSLDAGERSALQEAGTTIRFLPYLPGFSTTELIRRVAAAQSGG